MKKIFLGLVGIFVFFGAGCVPVQTRSFTMAEIKAHAVASDCWVIIHNKVYNVTSYVPRHSGGPIIIQSCGKDGTTLFESRPDSGTSHSTRAKEMLQELYLGELRNE